MSTAGRTEKARAAARRLARESCPQAADEDISSVIDRYEQRPNVRNIAGYIHALAENGDLARDLEDIRQAREREAARDGIEARRSAPACEHGMPGGAELHPETRLPRCPLCRSAAGPVPDDQPVAGQPEDETPALAAIPAYPAELLCGPLADLVTSTTLPPGLVGGAGLGALAGLCGLADLRMPDDALVRPVLWIALVAPRGAGKTPAMDTALDSLRELDSAAHEDYRRAMAQWREKPQKERGDLPSDPTRRIDDATLESIARWLDRGDGTGLVESDELSGWLQSIGQYKRISGDKGRWLAMWSAQAWRYQRVGNDRDGGKDIYITRPVLSILGGIQPHLHYLLGDEDSGFRPRWLPHMTPLTSVEWGRRNHQPNQWNKAIRALYALRKPREWVLTGEAETLWQAATREWKRQARNAESSAASAALVKSDIQCARVALVIAESMNPGAGGQLPREAMTCAIAITEYVMNCWRALPEQHSFALSIRDEKLARKIDQLASWLENCDGHSATRREILRANVAGVRSAAQLDLLLAEYEQVHPGTVIRERTGKRGPASATVRAPARQPGRATAVALFPRDQNCRPTVSTPHNHPGSERESAGQRAAG